MITLELVFSAYLECRKHKRRTNNQINFEFYLIENCIELQKLINDRTYYPGKSIAFIVTKPKPREVFAANFRDRIVHHIIMQRLEPLFEKVFVETSFNCRKNKGILYGARQLQLDFKKCSNNYTQTCYVVKFDLQGFFLSINKSILWNKVEKFIDENYLGADKEDIKWLSKIIILHCPEKNCEKRSRLKAWNLIPVSKSLFCVGDNFGLPIGNLTSLIFANYYLNDFDHFIKNKFPCYGRYVDDFYVVTLNKHKILEFIPKIRKYLSETVGVKLHPNKFYILEYYKGCDFIGYAVKKDRLYIGNRTIRHCQESIIEYNKRVGNPNKFICSLNSYFGFMKHTRAFNIKSDLTKTINSKWNIHLYNGVFYNKEIPIPLGQRFINIL